MAKDGSIKYYYYKRQCNSQSSNNCLIKCKKQVRLKITFTLFNALENETMFFNRYPNHRK